MSQSWPIDPNTLSPTGPLRLLVTWRPTRTDPGVGEIAVDQDVQVFLRDACEETLYRIRERRPQEYTPDMQQQEDECIVVLDDELVVESAIGKAVFSETPLAVTGPRDLPPGGLSAYVVLAGDGAERRAFVRRANPRRSAGGSKLMAVMGAGVERLEAPVFSFDDHFDLVLTGEGVIALDQKVFEAVFKGLADEAIEGWVQHLANCLPLAGNGARLLADCCSRSAVLRRKLKALAQSGHLPRLSPDNVRGHLQALRLPEREFITAEGELVFDRARPSAILDLLNEDLMVGPFSGSLYRVDRKSAEIQD